MHKHSEKSFSRRLLGSLIYYLHVGLMTLFFFSGFFFGWQWVVLVYLLIELQLIIFDGCGVTKLQQEMGDLKSDEDFIPFLMMRFFKVKITEFQHSLISYFIMGFPVYVVITKYWLSHH